MSVAAWSDQRLEQLYDELGMIAEELAGTAAGCLLDARKQIALADQCLEKSGREEAA